MSDTVTWTTPGGDVLRFRGIGSYYPSLEGEDRVCGWIAHHPRDYPNALFSLCVSLLEILREADMLTSQAVVDAGLVVEKETPAGETGRPG